jgi:cytochrome c biogenesis protein CcdA
MGAAALAVACCAGLPLLAAVGLSAAAYGLIGGVAAGVVALAAGAVVVGIRLRMRAGARSTEAQSQTRSTESEEVRHEARLLRADLLFGIGYGTASLSCTLPIFLAATGTAVTGSIGASVLSFAAYAAGMGTVLTALAVAAALSRNGLALALRRVLPYVNRLSGAPLVLAGTYVI